MKSFLPFVFLFLAQISLGQSKFGLKVTAFPNISDVMYMESEDQMDAGFPIESVKSQEVSSLSFSGGVGVQFKVSDRVTVSTGINYVRTGYETKRQSLPPILELNDPLIPAYWKYYYRQEHLEVPLQLGLTLHQRGDWSLYLLTGPSIWFNLRNQVTYESERGGDKEKEKREETEVDFHSTNMILTGGVGASKKINEKLEFFVQPTFQTALFGMAKNVRLNRRIHNFGLAFGFVFH